jgi:6-phosphogluconolactonase
MGNGVAATADIIVCKNPDSLALDAAYRFAALSAAATRTGRLFRVALAGGNTPAKLYRLLASAQFRDSIDWNSTHLFFGDERCVPIDSQFCNYKMAAETLISPLRLPEANIHRIQAEQPDPEQAALQYENSLAQHFGESTLPRFDLILLGMGSDGHTASLFPKTTALAENSRWVVRNEPGLEPFVPRVTLTFPVINNAANVLFLIAGKDKAAITVKVLTGPLIPQELPSQSVQLANGILTWLFDRDAARDLQL